jgi:hypothetical protein
VEIVKRLHQVVLHQVPIALEESRAKAIRPGAGVVLHGEKGSPDFVKGEGANQGGSLGPSEGGGSHQSEKVEGAGGVDGLPQESFEKIMKDPSLSGVGKNLVALAIVEILNLIFPKTARSAKVEIPRVFTIVNVYVAWSEFFFG